LNKHIELVKKWLADKDSVTPEELKANKKEAYYITNRTYGRGNALGAAFSAAAASIKNDGEGAAYWVKEYKSML